MSSRMGPTYTRSLAINRTARSIRPPTQSWGLPCCLCDALSGSGFSVPIGRAWCLSHTKNDGAYNEQETQRNQPADTRHLAGAR